LSTYFVYFYRFQKYFNYQKIKPGVCLKFFKTEGTDVKFSDVSFGYIENWFGGGRNKGNAIQYLVGEGYRRRGKLKQKFISRAFFFHPDLEVCNALASEAIDGLGKFELELI
jgi:hypothetical protein